MPKPSRCLAAALWALIVWPVPAAESPPVPFSMPMPAGWRGETLPFPLSFAPELNYQGLEELRFAPGMFEAGSEDFWTYAFVWWLPLETRLDADRLAADLEVYFRGLTESVSAAREQDPGAPEFRAELRETPDAGKGVRWLIGDVTTFDPFTTHEPIALNVSIRIWPCQEQERLVVFFELSPQPASSRVWQTLRQIRKGFRCQAAPADADRDPATEP